MSYWDSIKPAPLFNDKYGKGVTPIVYHTTNGGTHKEVYVDQDGRVYGTNPMAPLMRVQESLAKFKATVDRLGEGFATQYGHMLPRIAQLKGLEQALLQESNYTDVSATSGMSNYDLQRSISNDPAGWRKYFGVAEQNRDIAQIQDQRVNTQKNRMQSRTNAMNSVQDLLIQNESGLPTPRTRGTGLGSRADVFGGRVEAGLGV